MTEPETEPRPTDQSGRWRRGPRPSLVLTRWVFLRLLGVVYFCAFGSIALQIAGLVGEAGILPASSFLRAVHERFGTDGYRMVPTLFWLDCSDTALVGAAVLGTLLSVVLVAGIAPAPALAALWVLYLSIVSAGQDFLSFQWDILLLETGLLAVFLAPWKLWPRLVDEPEPSRLALGLGRWLLFRLMFASGAVKLLSGDPTWQDLTALSYHYETQPLPTWVGWYAHQLPAALQRWCTGAMFFVELALPLLIFGPRPVRLVAFAGLAGLQMLIALTGNYCYFNLLSLALCLLLLDDGVLSRVLPRRLSALATSLPSRPAEPWFKRACTIAFALWIVPASLTLLARQLARETFEMPRFAQSVLHHAAPLHSVSTYGLFAVMTTERLEIEVEGSDDGQTWRTYEFGWKPGDPKRRPGFVAPHQPRLDWQMWFAALGRYEQNRWFIEFLGRLLHGSRPVMDLLKTNPFPDRPPRYIRALLYRYHFTDRATREASGEWWRREPLGFYCPTLSISEGSR